MFQTIENSHKEIKRSVKFVDHSGNGNLIKDINHKDPYLQLSKAFTLLRGEIFPIPQKFKLYF